ncbi:MAG: hypothetical protein KDC58_03720 [Cyclobacteriaceae bacterium]|nr:hypothetical protein [Cyclobacteriaceae bacterium]
MKEEKKINSSELRKLKNKLIAERKEFRNHFITAISNLEINRLDQETKALQKLVA